MSEIVEVWRPCIEWEGTYEVSNLGRVRSVDRIIKHGSVGFVCRKQQIRRQSLTKDGYPTIHLSKTLDGRRIEKSVKVHRLVAFAFLGSPAGSALQVNHKDGVKTNNTPSNLEWVTHSGNAKHAFATGLMKTMRGEKHPSSNLTANEVLAIRADTRPQRAIAATYGVTQGIVCAIKQRRNWAHVQ